VRGSCVIFCVNEIFAFIGAQQRLASHMLPILCQCQRLQTFSRLDVKYCIFMSVCLFLCLSVYLFINLNLSTPRVLRHKWETSAEV